MQLLIKFVTVVQNFVCSLFWFFVCNFIFLYNHGLWLYNSYEVLILIYYQYLLSNKNEFVYCVKDAVSETQNIKEFNLFDLSCSDKHHGQKEVGEENFISSFWLKSIIKGKQGKS